MNKFLLILILSGGVYNYLYCQPSAEIRYSVLTEDSSIVYTPRKASKEKYSINVFWNGVDHGFAGKSRAQGRVISYSPNDLNHDSRSEHSKAEICIRIIHNSEKMEITIALSSFGNYRLDSIPFIPGDYKIDINEVCTKRYVENKENVLNGYHNIAPYEWIGKREED